MLPTDDLIKSPIALVQDFDKFTNYIINNPIFLSSTSAKLKNKDLYIINGILTEPQKNMSPKQSQIAYPLLDLFYRICIEGNLFLREGAMTRLTLIPTHRYEEYCKLNSTEKYLSLLMIFWTEMDWKRFETSKLLKLNELPLYAITSFLFFVSSLQPEEEILTEDHPLERLFYMLHFSIKYFAYFGFWNLKKCDVSRVMFYIKSLTPTDLGIELSKILFQERDLFFWNRCLRNNRDIKSLFYIIDNMEQVLSYLKENRKSREMITTLEEKLAFYVDILNEQKGVPYLHEPFHSSFKNIFSTEEVKNPLSSPNEFYKKGFYIFRVILDSKNWVRIGLYHYHTLEDLYQLIDSYFEVVEGYLYSFFMDNKAKSSYCYNSSLNEIGPFANEIEIGNLNLEKGRRFLHIINFINENRFTIIVEEIKSVTEELLYETGIME